MAKVSNYLLDTHTFLWSLSDLDKLSSSTKLLLEDPKVDIYVSAVSIWEIAIKKSLGKLQAPDSLQSAIVKMQFKKMLIDMYHAEYVEALPHYHNDPFDRLLISQAIVEDLVIITNDTKFTDYNARVLKA